MQEKLTFRLDLDDSQWDEALAKLGGHPLQSARWGRARHRADGLGYVAMAAFHGTEAVWMARAEIRTIPALGKVAWIPKGPAFSGPWSSEVHVSGLRELASQGFVLCTWSPWRPAHDELVASNGPRTIWIDLTKGRQQLWAELQKKWRHGVGYAARAGVTVAQTREERHTHDFFGLCRAVSRAKSFELPASEPLMRRLIEGANDGPLSTHLFIASHEGRLAAGAFVLRCGRSVHYFWGATNRDLAELRPGEAVQWAVIEWALSQGCEVYDLEGIDPVGNPGVYQFKKKMGGREIGLEQIHLSPFGLRGGLIASVLSRRLRLNG
jgi:hypothetical protein